MNTGQILSLFLKGAMGSKGRKRARKAANFLGGHQGFLSASAVIGAAGVAWGIYETLQQQGATAVPPAPGTPPEAGVTPSPDAGFPPEVLQIVRLAVSAARADGTLLPAERALILSHAREAGVESIVEQELATPRSLPEIVGGVTDETRRRELYVLAFALVRADEQVSGAERVYLAQLAHLLQLSPAIVAELEGRTASSIDAQPDIPPPPAP